MLLLAEELKPLNHVLDHTLIYSESGTPLLTLHMVTVVVAALLLIGVMMLVARAIATGPASHGNARYVTKGKLSQFVEVIVLYMRDTVIRPILGENTNKYLAFLLSIFFFILTINLIGLIPFIDMQALAWLDAHNPAWFGGTATANLAVTGALAIIAFMVIQVHGLRDLGFLGWLRHLLGGAPWWLFPIMVPVELMSLIIKPGALAIRLFANMLAGHTLMAVIAGFGMLAYQGTDSWLVAGSISVVSVLFSVAITFLELFVAFLQAFIFMFLTTIFIGQLSHHDDHGDDHASDHGHEGEHAHA